MRHIIVLETADLEKLFGDGLQLPAGEDAVIKADFFDVPTLTLAIKATIKQAASQIEPKGPRAQEGGSSQIAARGEAGKSRTVHAPKKRGPYKKKERSAHQKTHKPKREQQTFRCEEHGQTFFNAQALGAHRRYQHGEGDKEFKCRPCGGKTFPNQGALEAHQDIVHGVKQIAAGGR